MGRERNRTQTTKAPRMTTGHVPVCDPPAPRQPLLLKEAIYRWASDVRHQRSLGDCREPTDHTQPAAASGGGGGGGGGGARGKQTCVWKKLTSRCAAEVREWRYYPLQCAVVQPRKTGAYRATRVLNIASHVAGRRRGRRPCEERRCNGWMASDGSGQTSTSDHGRSTDRGSTERHTSDVHSCDDCKWVRDSQGVRTSAAHGRDSIAEKSGR